MSRNLEINYSTQELTLEDLSLPKDDDHRIIASSFAIRLALVALTEADFPLSLRVNLPQNKKFWGLENGVHEFDQYDQIKQNLLIDEN